MGLIDQPWVRSPLFLSSLSGVESKREADLFFFFFFFFGRSELPSRTTYDETSDELEQDRGEEVKGKGVKQAVGLVVRSEFWR